MSSSQTTIAAPQTEELKMPVWRFVAQSTEPNVGYRYTEEVMPDGEIHFDGDSEEALEMARLISGAGDFNWIAAVCEDDLPDEPDWMLFRVVERSDNKGWDLEANAVTGRLWYRERNSAVSYAVDSAKGHIAVVRLIERDGALRSMLLIDRREVGSNRLYRRDSSMEPRDHLREAAIIPTVSLK